MKEKEIWTMAEILHYKYEHFARVVGWKTQGVCRVDFNKLPKRNKSVMIFMAKFVLKEKALSEGKGYEIGFQEGCEAAANDILSRR